MKQYIKRRTFIAGLMFFAVLFSFSSISHAQTTSVEPKDDKTDYVSGVVVALSNGRATIKTSNNNVSDFTTVVVGKAKVMKREVRQQEKKADGKSVQKKSVSVVRDRTALRAADKQAKEKLKTTLGLGDVVSVVGVRDDNGVVTADRIVVEGRAKNYKAN